MGLPEQVLSTDLKFFQRVQTVEGKNLHVIKSKSGVYTGADLKNLKKVTGADNLASNGVAHIIDGVMLPPSGLTADKPNIVELAQSIDDFSTLVTAVVAADLADTLSSPGPFTVFAPVNAAFAELGQEKLNELLANPDQLGSILTYHVVSGEAFSSSLSDGQQIETVNGAMVTVSISMDGAVMI